jgi:hypothetical protein
MNIESKEFNPTFNFSTPQNNFQIRNNFEQTETEAEDIPVKIELSSSNSLI